MVFFLSSMCPNKARNESKNFYFYPLHHGENTPDGTTDPIRMNGSVPRGSGILRSLRFQLGSIRIQFRPGGNRFLEQDEIYNTPWSVLNSRFVRYNKSECEQTAHRRKRYSDYLHYWADKRSYYQAIRQSYRTGFCTMTESTNQREISDVGQ
jgi:hypothetical protein